jgi:uncharacterized protein
MKFFLAVAFPLVTLGIFAASIWYVADRLRTLFGLTRRWPIRMGIATGFIASLFAMLSAARATSALAGILNVLGGDVFAVYIFLTLLLLVHHSVQWKWPLPGKWAGSAALVLALAITAAGALWADHLTVTETEIALPGLQKEVSVMHLSDVHIGHHRGRAWLEKIVAETNRRRPDIVLINGDLVDSDAALAPGVLSPLAGFKAPVYFVGGNHDNYVDTARAFELFTRHGVRVLHNEIVDTHGIRLVGLDYMNPDANTFDMHPSEDNRTIQKELPKLPLATDRPVVLMHHSPVGIDYVAAAGVDLMLSGHTHAGQIFPATLLTPLIFPLNKGLYTRGDTTFFVSGGAGTYGLRIRLGTTNEINLIRLKKRGSEAVLPGAMVFQPPVRPRTGS